MPRRFAFLPILVALAGPAAAVERTIEKEVLVDAPLDPVWNAWTTRAGIVGFFAPDAEIDPRVDGAFRIFVNPCAEPGMKGADTMRYLAIQPKTMPSFDWNAPLALPATRGQRTFVVLRFEARGARTRPTLFHAGRGSADDADGRQWEATFQYFDEARDTVLASLQKRYAPGGQPVDWTEWNAQMKKMSIPE